jgi:hypothetical protein
MSKSFKYVKEFEFPSTAGYSGSAGKQMVKGYSRGGMKSEMNYDKADMKGMKSGGEVKTTIKPGGMLKDKSSLGIKNNKNPGETRAHTAPKLPGPKMAMKAGGPVMPKAGYNKMDKVMTEFKDGDLRSGSKTGSKVTNPKQAVAIAMSEARRADKKKK